MPHIRAIVAEERLLHQTAEELHTLAAGKVRVGTFTSVATHWLPAMMMRFQQEHPQVEFELFNGDYHDVDRWLADGSVDLAFVALPAEADSRCVPLYRDELVAVLPKGHRLCSLPVCPAAEIAKEPIIPVGDLQPRCAAGTGRRGRQAGYPVPHQGRLRRHCHGAAGAGRQHHAVPAAAGQQ